MQQLVTKPTHDAKRDNSFFSQLRILDALMIKELIGSFGRENIGFIWFVIEPMILVVGVLVIRHFMLPPYEHGMPLLDFVFTGYMPLTLWRHITSAAAGCIRKGRDLLFHRRITVIDLWISRTITEFIGSTVAFIVVYAALVVAGVLDPIENISLFLLGWFLMAWFSLGASAFLAACTEWSELAHKFIQPVQYFMLPLSGSFFLVDWLPDSYQELATYSPWIGIFELIRAGFFGTSITTHIDVLYSIKVCLVTNAVGLYALNAVRDHVKFS